MATKRALLASALTALLVGCNGPSPASKADRVDGTKAGEKTVDDARKYMQEQIDRYLGGQRTEAQLSKITKDVGPSLKIINKGPIQSISIINVLPWYSEKGEKQKNGFVLTRAFSGAGWQENITVHLSQSARGDGEWVAI
jgi:hypothetical protein